MSTFTCRTMTREDIPAAVKLWNEAFAETTTPAPMTEERFAAVLFDDKNFNAPCTLAAEADGRLVGVIGCKRASVLENDGRWYVGTPGVVSALYVHPAYRRRGVASELLARAEATDQAAGRIFSVASGLEGQSFFFPGVDSTNAAACKLFEKRGYRYVRQTNHLEVMLGDYSLPARVREQKERLEAQGFRFSRGTAQDLEAYRGYWQESEWHGQTEQNVAKFEQRPDAFILAWRGARIVGQMNGLRVDAQGEAAFDFIGLLPEHRRGGLGSVILGLGLEWFREHGARRSFIWTYEQAAEGFYPRLGYQMVTRWLAYLKPLAYDPTSREWIGRWGH